MCYNQECDEIRSYSYTLTFADIAIPLLHSDKSTLPLYTIYDNVILSCSTANVLHKLTVIIWSVVLAIVSVAKQILTPTMYVTLCYTHVGQLFNYK